MDQERVCRAAWDLAADLTAYDVDDNTKRLVDELLTSCGLDVEKFKEAE